MRPGFAGLRPCPQEGAELEAQVLQRTLPEERRFTLREHLPRPPGPLDAAKRRLARGVRGEIMGPRFPAVFLRLRSCNARAFGNDCHQAGAAAIDVAPADEAAEGGHRTPGVLPGVRRGLQPPPQVTRV